MSSPDVLVGAIGVAAAGLVAALGVMVLSLWRVARGSSAPRFSALAVLYVAVVVYAVLVVAPRKVDAMLNGLADKQVFPALTEEERLFHATLAVADLHADSLMWPSRDLLLRNSHGHVDLPRLIEGRIAIQGFTLVTSSPAGLNFVSNAAPNSIFSDQLALKAALENWGGLAAVRSARQRALFQIRQLHELEHRSNGTLVIVKRRADLDNVLRLHSGGAAVVGGFLGIEGMHALDDRLDSVAMFYSQGVRMAGLAHFFDNGVSGSAHGLKKGGLTALGRQVLEEMIRLNYLIDFAHVSHKSIGEIIAQNAGRAVLMSSHTGVQAVCDSAERNLDDSEIKAIAASGGVVGIALFAPAVCGDNLITSAVASIAHVSRLVGSAHAALGSDWDGTVKTAFDATGTRHLTAALMREGFTRDEVRAIMGDNVVRMLRRVLPE